MSVAQQDRGTAFGGAAGRVLNDAMSLQSFFSGMVIAFVLFVIGSVAALTDSPGLVNLVVHVGTAVVLARFAVNGACGEWSGHVFSVKGGGWIQVYGVAARYLLLNLIWLTPLLLLGLRLPDGPALLSLLQGAGGGKLLALIFAYALVSCLAPPILLIAAAGAGELKQLWSPDHWRACFHGRSGDLLVVYAIYIGGLTVALFMALPPIVLAAFDRAGLAALLLALTFAFFCGYATNLLGRLCGFYLLGELPEVRPAAGAPAAGAPAAGAPAAGAPAAGAPAAGFPAAGAPAAGSPARSSAPGSAHRGTALPSAAVPGRTPARTEGGVGAGAGLAQKRAILDLDDRLLEAWQRFEADRDGAIRSLEELKAVSLMPTPRLMHALTSMQARAGDLSRALESARETLPLLFERGNLQLAADIFRLLQGTVEQLGLSREQLLVVGATLRSMSDWRSAANANAAVLRTDPAEVRAIDAMIEVSEDLLATADGLEDARRLLAYLNQHARPQPQAADRIRRCLVECERRLAGSRV